MPARIPFTYSLPSQIECRHSSLQNVNKRYRGLRDYFGKAGVSVCRR